MSQNCPSSPPLFSCLAKQTGLAWHYDDLGHAHTLEESTPVQCFLRSTQFDLFLLFITPQVLLRQEHLDQDPGEALRLQV